MAKIRNGNVIYTASELIKHVKDFSSKYSDIIRQLIIAGVAIDWIFLFNSKSEDYNFFWLLPLILFVSAICYDAYYYFTRLRIYRQTLGKKVVVDDPTYEIPLEDEKRRSGYQKIRNVLAVLGYAALTILICCEMFKTKDVLLVGSIYNSETKQPIQGSFIIYDKTKSKTDSVVTDSSGEFKIHLCNNRDYIFQVASSNFFVQKGRISADSAIVSGYKKMYREFYLTPLKIDTPQVLKDILFDFGSDKLRVESFIELSDVAVRLNDNTDLMAMISAHTDSKGDDNFNLRLSIDRARSVCRYLESQQVDSVRLFSSGYGESKPIAPNDNEEHRQLNRRVEIRYLMRR